ncbi:hypothetical protein [Staphylococcus gallinarum]|uniref:hypothetical protein n=1 Tax=Staphylococcus TaxID=1279 RepID=UPI000E6A59E4|nr:hypothetical protein [Staphylococcus gallinarum]RIL23373.1 hypothetical protein BUY99_05130 [Staphylococcus gallinarum]
MESLKNKLLVQHEIIRENLKIDSYRKHVINEEKELDKKMEHFLSNNELNVDIFDDTISNFITVDQRVIFYYVKLKEVFIEYYVTKDMYESNAFDIFSKDFKVVGRIRMSADFMNQEHSNPYVLKLFKQHGFMVELINLNSFGKGYGKHFIKDLKNFSKITKLPIWLYDMNSKNKNYFKNLGFKFKGNLGENNEPLLLFNPK